MTTSRIPSLTSLVAPANTPDGGPDKANASPAAGGPWLHAVVDANGVTLRNLLPGQFADIAAGRVGVLARPGMRRATWLANDLLCALGCSNLITGSRRPGEAEHELAIAWLKAHEIRHIYVQYAWSVGHTALTEIVEIAHRAGCHLWLVGDAPYTEHHVLRLEPYDPVTWTGEEFLAHWTSQIVNQPNHEPAYQDVDRPDSQPFPALTATHWPDQLPSDDFTTFRAACRDYLSQAQFHAVDDHLLACHQLAVADLLPTLTTMTDRSLTTGPTGPAQTEAAPSATHSIEQVVASWLAGHWEDTPTLQHFVVLLRATQVAAFNAGFHLQVDLDQLIATAAQMPRRALRTREVWARLHAYPEPHRGAVCALAAAGLSIDDMPEVTVGSFDPASGAVLVGGNVYAIELHAQLFLTAQQHYRRVHGASDHDPLFVRSNGQAYAPRAFSTIIKTTRRELGVAVATARIDRATITGDRWFTRWGICIQELL